MKLMNQTLATLLLLGLTVSVFAQEGGGIVVTGDPTQVGSHDQNATGGGSIVIPDEGPDPLRQQSPPAPTATRDETAHKRLDGHDGQVKTLRADVDTLRTDFEAYKTASRQERMAAYQGDNVRLATARVQKSRARTNLRKKGVSENVFSEAKLFKALEAALKSGKLDNLLRNKLNTWMADEGTTLGRMFAQTQKIASMEATLYGEGGTKDDPKGLVGDVRSLQSWAKAQGYDPSKDYDHATKDFDPTADSKPANPPAAGTTPSAPADKGTSEPSKGTEQGTNPAPPADKPTDPAAEKAKAGAKPGGLFERMPGAAVPAAGAMALALGCFAIPGLRRRIASAR